MSLAEEMLATMPLSYNSGTYLADEEPHIVINESRQAIVPNELKTIAVTGDKDIETVTFDCVRYWDGNDLSTFAIYLNYVLPDSSTGTYIPDEIVTSDGDEFYHFDWKIKNNITKKSGQISFAITAIKTKLNDGGVTVVEKQWSSIPNGDCSIALGLDISNVPSEEESSDVVAQLSAILEKIHGDLDEWIKTVVVQTTGTSKTQVMSQEAVTTSLNIYKVESIQQSNEYTDSKSNLLDKKILQNSNKISRNSKRITNLEQGLTPDPFVTDDSVAYAKTVPEGALPYAAIHKIGGMTYRDETTNALRSAKVTEVKSVGANLIPSLHERTAHGVTIKKDTDGVYYLSGTATNNVDEIIPVGLPKGRYSLKLNCSKAIGTTNGDSIYIACRTSKMNWILTIGAHQGDVFINAEVSEIKDILFVISAGVNCDGVTIAPMLNKGSTAKPYTPYVEHILPIPEELRPANGINAEVYDSIEVNENGSVTKRVKCGEVDLGTLDWHYMDTFGTGIMVFVSYGITDILYPTTTLTKGNIRCSLYNTSRADDIANKRVEKAICLYGNNKVVVRDDSYADIATFKAAMSGVMLVYELAEPEITDISDLITADNLIGVEGGGTLTFENEYGYAVPSEVEYQVEV